MMIRNITNEKLGVVTLLQGQKHPYEDGDHIIINEVVGMEKLEENLKNQQVTKEEEQKSQKEPEIELQK